MRRWHLLTALAAVVVIGAGVAIGVSAISGEREKLEIYTYPITPDDPEWANYNHAELVSMLQIPEDILDNMTDAELVESVLDYPYIGDVMAYSTVELGMRVVSEHFNGLKELLNRPGTGKILIEKYRQSPTEEELHKEEDSDILFEAWAIEFILSYMNARDILNSEERQTYYETMKEHNPTYFLYEDSSDETE